MATQTPAGKALPMTLTEFLTREEAGTKQKRAPKPPKVPKPPRTPQQNGKRSKQKGRKWEQDIANLLRETLGPDAAMRQGHYQVRAGHEGADVVVKAVGECPAIWCEAKVGKSVSPKAALAQAQAALLLWRQAGGAASTVAVAICKEDNKTPFVTMQIADWLTILALAHKGQK